MIKYLMYGIYDRRCRLFTRIPIHDEGMRDKVLEHLQENGKFPPYFAQKIREPLISFSKRIINITVISRKIAGESIVKSGDSRRWMKIFRDHYITSVVAVPGVDLTNLIEQKVTAHKHKGEIRVITETESISIETFTEQAKINWPEDWQVIISKLKGLDIVKDVIATKQAAIAAHEAKRKKAEERRKILDLINTKKDEQLSAASIEELEKKLAALDD